MNVRRWQRCCCCLTITLLSAAAVGQESDDRAQIYCRWIDSGVTAKLTNLTTAPAALAWSPDGRRIAFSMLVKDESEPLAKMPEKPEGAEWAEPPKVVRQIRYRVDCEGYLKEGKHHLFVLPADGCTPLQVTAGDYDHENRPAGSPEGDKLYFSSNRNPDADLDPLESEVYEITLEIRDIAARFSESGTWFENITGGLRWEQRRWHQ